MLYDIISILSDDFINRNPIFLGVMNGSFMFMSDLMKKYLFNAKLILLKYTVI